MLLPTLALIDSLLNNHFRLDRILHPTLVPFTAASIIGGFLFMTARRRLLKLSAYDVMATKVILLFQILVIVQALESSIVDLICFLVRSREWWVLLAFLLVDDRTRTNVTHPNVIFFFVPF